MNIKKLLLLGLMSSPMLGMKAPEDLSVLPQSNTATPSNKRQAEYSAEAETETE